MEYSCPHCGQLEPTPPPASFRRTLVIILFLQLALLTGYGVFNLVEIAMTVSSPVMIAFTILGFWGTIYSAYLSVSFILIGALRLPGCEFVAINHVVRSKRVHRCVDSVLNSVLDLQQQQRGISRALFKTESAQKWILGILLLALFLFLQTSNIVSLATRNILLGVFGLGYFGYDLSLHRASVGRTDLKGKGDYTRLLRDIVSKFLKG